MALSEDQLYSSILDSVKYLPGQAREPAGSKQGGQFAGSSSKVVAPGHASPELIKEINSTTYYHGTGSEFQSFSEDKIGTGADAGSTNWYGAGFYLSAEEWKAKAYAHAAGETGSVVSIKVTVKNPLVVEGTAAHELGKALEKVGIKEVGLQGHKLTLALKDKGFDSVLVLKKRKGAHNELVIFNSTQAKLVKRQKVSEFAKDTKPFDTSPIKKSFSDQLYTEVSAAIPSSLKYKPSQARQPSGSSRGGEFVGSSVSAGSVEDVEGYHRTSTRNANKIIKEGFKPADGVFGKAVYLAPTPETIVAASGNAHIQVSLKDVKLNKDFSHPNAYEDLIPLRRQIAPTTLEAHFTSKGFDGLDLKGFSHEPQVVIYNASKITSVNLLLVVKKSSTDLLHQQLTVDLSALKYSPNQARVPAGRGGGGQFTSGGTTYVTSSGGGGGDTDTLLAGHYKLEKKEHPLGATMLVNGVEKKNQAYSVKVKGEVVGEIRTYSDYKETKLAGQKYVTNRKDVVKWQATVIAGHHEQKYHPSSPSIMTGAFTQMGLNSKDQALETVIKIHKLPKAQKSLNENELYSEIIQDVNART